jgi:hypothetical protein
MPSRTTAFVIAGTLAGLAAWMPALASAEKAPHAPALEARALLPADATWPAPFPATQDADPGDAPGSVQPVGGFSALIDGGHGTWLAMPDNGFGNKANSLVPAAPLPRASQLRARRHGHGEDPRRDHAARSRPQDPVRYRPRRDDRPAADGRRLRHRVGPHGPPRRERGFVVDLDEHDGPAAPLPKREVVDLLAIADPRGISLPGRPGDVGLGNPFSMPYVTIEAVLPLGGKRLAIVNDTNCGSTGRNPALPDYSDFIVVTVPHLKSE